MSVLCEREKVYLSFLVSICDRSSNWRVTEEITQLHRQLHGKVESDLAVFVLLNTAATVF